MTVEDFTLVRGTQWHRKLAIFRVTQKIAIFGGQKKNKKIAIFGVHQKIAIFGGQKKNKKIAIFGVHQKNCNLSISTFGILERGISCTS